MRANDQIVPGHFLGGNIEPGTFHCGWYPSQFLGDTPIKPGNETDSDERVSSASQRPIAAGSTTAVNSDVSTEADIKQEVTVRLA